MDSGYYCHRGSILLFTVLDTVTFQKLAFPSVNQLHVLSNFQSVPWIGSPLWHTMFSKRC